MTALFEVSPTAVQETTNEWAPVVILAEDMIDAVRAWWLDDDELIGSDSRLRVAYVYNLRYFRLVRFISPVNDHEVISKTLHFEKAATRRFELIPGFSRSGHPASL